MYEFVYNMTDKFAKCLFCKCTSVQCSCIYV